VLREFFDPSLSRPGDVLLFSRQSIFNRLIAWKTWSRYTHVEVVSRWYPTQVYVAASRNGKGCDVYPADFRGLSLILRPGRPFNPIRANNWWDRVAVGQGYDWLGLLNFWAAKTRGNNGKMFCSEAATRYLRAGGFDPFNGDDADRIAPSDFAKNSGFVVMWRASE
jgi:hypothetical protein